MNAFKWLDLDSALGILAKLINAGSHFGTALLVAFTLPLPEQGIFFTLLSCVTLATFVELGLNTVVIQFTAHETAALRTAPPDSQAYADAKSRLLSIGRFAFAWFLGGAALFFAILTPGGFVFFAGLSMHNAILPGPWLCLTVAVAADIAFFPFWALLEGSGEIHTVYTYRSVRALCMAVVTWVLLLSGAGLWSVGIGFLAILPASLFTVWKHRRFFMQFLSRPDGPRVSWKGDMVQFQWRLAASWIAGYFCLWAATPITLHMFGPSIAGQVGMTWSIATGIQSISSAVVAVKSARFGQLVARREFRTLDHLALRQGAASVALAVLGALTISVAVWIFTHYGLALSQRFLPLWQTALILLGMVIQQLAFPMATYLRAFKREPFLGLSVGLGCLMVTTLVVFGHLFGPPGISIAYLSCSLLFQFPCALLIFHNKRQKWTMAKL